MTIRKLFEKPWTYSLLLDEDTDTHALDVACDGVVMYTVRILAADLDRGHRREGAGGGDGL
jgi:hypothetical protein